MYSFFLILPVCISYPFNVLVYVNEFFLFFIPLSSVVAYHGYHHVDIGYFLMDNIAICHPVQ